MSRRVILLLAVATLWAGLCAAAAPAPAERQAPTERQRAQALAKEARVLVEQGKLADAEEALLESVDLTPAEPIRHYELARVRARLGKPDEAVESLERAAGLGFTDFHRMTRDPDLASLHDRPGFRRLLDRKDEHLRRTAEGTLVALRNRFGDAGEYRYAIDHERRLILAAAADDAAMSRLRSGLEAQAAALQAALFEHAPEAYVTVLMPTAADYSKLVRYRNVPGIYVDANKTVVARDAGYVLAHEFTHALHAADRAPLGQEHAPWVAEGLGALCEAADFTDGELRPRDNARFASLVGAARRKALIPLDRLVAMDQEAFVRRPNLTYGQSAYLMLYLWDRGLLRPFYDAYKSTHAIDPTGRAALEQVTGKAAAELHEDWRRWLAARPPAAWRR
jgi:tetratricopeptide (TPR) repeat protein